MTTKGDKFMHNAPVYNSIRNDVLKRYPDGTYYHSVRHIENITSLFNSKYDELMELPNCREGFESKDNIYDITMTALLFHDVVYVVGRQDNEEKSVDYAFQYLRAKHLLNEHELSLVKDIILYTKMVHGVGTPVKQLVHDLDWIGFSSYASLCANDVFLKKEAMRDGYTEEQYHHGQVKFLTFYANKDIYESPFYRKFNDHAKENIKKFLKEFYGGH